MTYCSDCGRPLNDGEVCNCTAGQQPQAPYVPQEPYAQAPQEPYTPVPQEPYVQAPPEPYPPAPAGQPPYQAPPPQQPYQAAPPQQPYQQPQPGYQAPPPGYQQAAPAYAPPKAPSMLMTLLKNFFKSPEQSSVQVLNSPQQTMDSLILGGILLVLNAIYYPVLVNRVVNGLIILTSRNISRRDLAEAWSYIDLPIAGLIFTGVISAAILVALVAVIWLLLGRGPNGSVDFKRAFFGSCVASYPAAMCVLLAVLAASVSVMLSGVVLVGAGFVYLVNSASIYQDVTGKRGGYLYGALFFVAWLIAMFVAFKMLDIQVMNIAIDGETLSDYTGLDSLTEAFGELLYYAL